jgi:MFS family permease
LNATTPAHPSPIRVIFPVAIGTCLSLLGDSTLYTVLPTHTAAAGIGLASIGLMLSVNRWVRLVLNGPLGFAYDRWRKRPAFITALFLGAISTTIYGFASGFWPLLVGRILWGISWAGIWVGGNAIVLDISTDQDRGKWIGTYQISFFLGAAGGAILGGALTDLTGYHQAMKLLAALSTIGAVLVALFLPETKGLSSVRDTKPLNRQTRRILEEGKRFAPAITLLGINRLVVPGILTATFGLFLSQQIGDPIHISGRTFGVATITGFGLGIATLISMFAAPLAGLLSDRLGNRWKVAAFGLIPGIFGFFLLSRGIPILIFMGVPLIAYTSGSNQGLATSITGDNDSRSWRLGVLFTVGDLTSAIGPLLAYALIPIFDIAGVYGMAAGSFLLMLLIALGMSSRRSSQLVA